jgi:S-adenosylmethionine-diacylgycerolhomoserine-N-methlytransferase
MSVQSHAALMDGVYRRQRYIYDFTRKYYLFGRDSLIRELPLEAGQSLVEIGCGTARNLILIARRYPGVRLFGLDASHEMLKTAHSQVARAGLENRIALAHGYAESLTPALFGEDRLFDHALFSYSLSMIPQWKQSFKSAAAALAPNGKIHAVDFGDLTGLGRAGAGLMKAWLALFHVTPRKEILGALETVKRQYPQDKAILRMLAGRYAFLLHCEGLTVQNMLAVDVAGVSQRLGNSDEMPVISTLAMDNDAPH